MLRRQVVLSIAIAILFAGPASAQTTGAWEIEFFAGGMLPSHPSGGTGTLPAPGATYTTITLQPSRKVSSWYFGDGSQLLNSVLESFGRTERLTPLDPIVNKAALGWQGAGSLGFRLRRHLSSRLAAEFSLQSGLGRLGLSDDGLKAVDETRDSFIVAWTALFGTGGFGSTTVTSVPTIGTGGRQLLTTGAVNFTLKTAGKLQPYVTGGAGLASRLGDLPDVKFVGEYRTLYANVSPISEHDSIRLHYTMPKSTFIWVVGGGASYALSPSTGLRGDVRFHLGSNEVNAFVNTSPTVDPSTNMFVLVTTPTTPTILFRNLPVPASTPSTEATFGPPALTDFRTFQGSGLQTQMSMTAGFFWRF